MKENRFGQAEPLSREEFRKLLDLIPGENHRLIFALCWYTCERPITILRLRVEQVYVKSYVPKSKIVIPASIRKDASTREIPIHPALARELRIYEAPGAGYLFPGKGAAGHLSQSAYDKALRRIFKKQNMRGFSTYSTRRGALTCLARAGLSLRNIQAISGHASLSSLQRYLEVTEQDKEAAISLL